MIADLIQSIKSVELLLTWSRKSEFLTLFCTQVTQLHIGRRMYPAFRTFQQLISIK